MGLTEEGTRDFFYMIVPDRFQSTFSSIFKKYIERGSTIITDGHAFYPGAVSINGSIHQKVNHFRGFVNIEGFHTNNIEKVWSLLKYERRKRRGVLKSSLCDFLLEFRFRYGFLRNNTRTELFEAFTMIVDFFFQKIKIYIFYNFYNPLPLWRFKN